VTPVVRPDEPSAAVTPAPQGSDLSIGGTPIMPAAGKGTVKKERVISMRGKISGDEAASKPAASPALSPEDQAAMFFGGTRPPPAVAIGGLTGNTPPAAPSETTPVAEKIVAEPKSGTIAKTMENASEPPVKPPELARIEPAASWESVPLDLAAAASETLPGPTLMPTPPAVDQVPGQLQPTTEPRLAVNLPPEKRIDDDIPDVPKLAVPEQSDRSERPAVTEPVSELLPSERESPPVPETPEEPPLVQPLPVAGAIALVRPQMVDAILGRYPSFITAPTARFFEPAGAEALMKALQDLLGPLMAFLSFTFMQTYLFYVRRSPKGDQVVKDALKAHFAGPNAMRFLHHLSLLIKDASGDSFFTIPLAKAMSESSADTNPLFILREMVEFLQTPPAEAAEGLAQVADALPPLLTAFKGILHNPIVMRLPPGAREPFLNLSGPRSAPLAADERPGLDLPPNEIILLSKDRSEALGLFPYFTFDGQKVVFKAPADSDFKTLLERLELTV